MEFRDWNQMRISPGDNKLFCIVRTCCHWGNESFGERLVLLFWRSNSKDSDRISSVPTGYGSWLYAR